MSAPAVLARAVHAAERGQEIAPNRDHEVGALAERSWKDPVYALELVEDVRHILDPIQRVIADEQCRARRVDALDADE
jgi:hypothetical protein